MANKGVSLRLGASGGSEVRAELKGIETTGETAFKNLGEEGERQFRRLSAAVARTATDVEAALERQNRAVARVTAFAGSNGLPVSGADRSVVESYVAAARASEGFQRSLVTTNERSGQTRAGMQQLSYQISDVATSFAGGINPMIIFAQQGSQVVQSIALMRAGAGGLIGFLAGPWGAALTGAATLLGLYFTSQSKAADGSNAVKAAATGTAGAVATLNAILAKDPSDLVAGSARNLARARLDQANATYAAARSEAALRQAQGQARLRDLADGRETLAVRRGRAGTTFEERALSTTSTRAGSELNRERTLAQMAVTSAAADLAALDKAYANAKARISAVAPAALSRGGGGGAVRSSSNDNVVAQSISRIADQAKRAPDEVKYLDDALARLSPAAAGANQVWKDMADIAKLTQAGRINDSERSAMVLRANGLGDSQGQLARDMFVDADKAMLAWVENASAKLPEIVSLMDVVGARGREAIDNVFSVRGLQDFGSAFSRLMESILDDLLQLAVANPLKNLLFKGDGEGGMFPTLGGGGLFGSLFGGLFGSKGGGNGIVAGDGGVTKILGTIIGGGLRIPGFASGTDYAPGGLAMVGENGRELIDLPRGSRVHNAAKTRQMMSGGMGSISAPVVINLNAQGAGPREIDMLMARLNQLQANLPGQIVSTVADARQRRLLAA